jgi:hypothetical protein
MNPIDSLEHLSFKQLCALLRIQLISLFRQQLALLQSGVTNKVHSSRKRILLLFIAGGLGLAAAGFSALWLCMVLYVVLRSVRVPPLHAAWLAPLVMALVTFFSAVLIARSAHRQSHR